MAMQVTMGAQMSCTFGVAPSALVVLPVNRTTSSGMPAANIMDYAPIVNIPPFGMCTSMANPMVLAATAAALGVPTPMPCIPVTVAPWVPGAPTVLIGNMPALDNSSKCMCAWGGVISFLTPGQFIHQIP
jgi:hypothetical protein